MRIKISLMLGLMRVTQFILLTARNWSQAFFKWYNTDHRHTGLGLMTLAAVHFGQAEKLIRYRHQTLQQAYRRHPKRFVKGAPQPLKPPDAVWINKPKPSS